MTQSHYKLKQTTATEESTMANNGAHSGLMQCNIINKNWRFVSTAPLTRPPYSNKIVYNSKHRGPFRVNAVQYHEQKLKICQTAPLTRPLYQTEKLNGCCSGMLQCMLEKKKHTEHTVQHQLTHQTPRQHWHTQTKMAPKTWRQHLQSQFKFKSEACL
jgi:hypothetical protein